MSLANKPQLCRASVATFRVATSVRESGISVRVRPAKRDRKNVIKAWAHEEIVGIFVNTFATNPANALVPLEQHRDQHALGLHTAKSNPPRSDLSDDLLRISFGPRLTVFPVPVTVRDIVSRVVRSKLLSICGCVLSLTSCHVFRMSFSPRFLFSVVGRIVGGIISTVSVSANSRHCSSLSESTENGKAELRRYMKTRGIG